jgi:hypothetical protein
MDRSDETLSGFLWQGNSALPAFGQIRLAASALPTRTLTPATATQSDIEDMMSSLDESWWDGVSAICLYYTIFPLFKQLPHHFRYNSGFFFTPFTRTSKWMWMPVAP